MKIAHVVTLVSPDGAFGGPVRVAVNLARAMRDAGHDATILGAYCGYDTAPLDLGGVPARLFPARRVLPLGFSGLIAPGLLAYLRRHVTDFDVIHVHLARDLITLPSALIARRAAVPYVTQTHGMVDGSNRWLAHLLDAFATRRVLRSASRVLHLTEQERHDLAQVARRPALPLTRIANGVPASDRAADVGSGREVLFLARLQARKRPVTFVEAAIALRYQFPGTRFTLVGPDEGEARAVLARIDAAGAQDTIAWEGPLEPGQTIARMSQASLYVLPSIDEPFPMAVLEAMSIGLPSIVTDTCGLADGLHDPLSLSIVDVGTDGLVNEIRRLLDDPAARVELGERGRREVQAHFSIDHVAAEVLDSYPHADVTTQRRAR